MNEIHIYILNKKNRPAGTKRGGRFRTAKSAFKSAFLGTFKSAFTRKSAF